MKKRYIVALCGCMAMLSGCGKAADIKTVTNERPEQTTIATSEEENEIAPTEDDSQSWEITFDGIPWGTTFVEVKERFPELELYAEKDSFVGAYYIDVFKDGVPTLSEVNSDLQLAFPANSKSVTDLTSNDDTKQHHTFGAEDCDICSITFYFAYATTDDEYIDYNADNALLYGVNYRVEGAAQTFGNIAERFRKLCGEPTDNYSEKKYDDTSMNYLVWENTDYLIAIHDEEAGFISSYRTWENSVEVTYAWKNGDKLLDEGAQALHDVKIINAKE